ncbi:hypothetical protein GGR39_003399 [Novosphingobium fluoreni]|uniref:Uncharacterized protein n=1 Tax=Novosphingobium fluoreni TaxID=1391222 RepID=A0A7W6FZT9_9SPHN|nr:hypothetical protein [Novosphingobium fluoreni]MBB3941718.1 hypothetical protein [Novosphingobium fluoreni]
MQRFRLTLGREVVLIAAITLAGCGGSSSKFSEAERNEIADIAGDGTVDEEAFATLEKRVAALEEQADGGSEDADGERSTTEGTTSNITSNSLLQRDASEPSVFERYEREKRIEELEGKVKQMELDKLIEGSKPD